MKSKKNPRAISFELVPTPESWADTARRFENYRRACMTLEDCARGYVEHLRAQHGDVAPVVTRGFLLRVGVLVLFIDDDELQVRIGQE